MGERGVDSQRGRGRNQTRSIPRPERRSRVPRSPAAALSADASVVFEPPGAALSKFQRHRAFRKVVAARRFADPEAQLEARGRRVLVLGRRLPADRARDHYAMSDGADRGLTERPSQLLGHGRWASSDLFHVPDSPFFEPPVEVGGVLLFGSEPNRASPIDDVELGTTDGMPAGTQRRLDIWSGLAGSFPEDFVVVGGRLFFSAGDPVAGFELRMSDGSIAGTVRLPEIEPGTRGSAPDALQVLGNTLVFWTFSTAAGRELFPLDLTHSNPS